MKMLRVEPIPLDLPFASPRCWARSLLLQFRSVYMLSLGLVLIAVVLLLPSGLAGPLRRRRA